MKIKRHTRASFSSVMWKGREAPSTLGEVGRRGSHGSVLAVSLGFVMRMGTAQEAHAIEHAFLKPLKRQINHRSDIESNQLRNYQPSDNHQPQRSTRRTVGAETESDRQRAHQRSERGHNNR